MNCMVGWMMVWCVVVLAYMVGKQTKRVRKLTSRVCKLESNNDWSDYMGGQE